jgi:glycine/D-amino acid oxidase-like deaminating enzyme
MMESRVRADTAIIGGGLAGTALAWAMVRRGVEVVVIDPEEPCTSSRVAAGLVTPIAGQRFVVSWDYEDAWPLARAHYADVEQASGQTLVRDRPMVRLIENEREAGFWATKRETLPRHLWRDLLPEDLPEGIDAPLGGMVMPGAARLDVPGYLSASRRLLGETGLCRYLSARVPVDGGLARCHEGWRLDPPGLLARRVVFCQGFEAADNPWFQGLIFNPSKGEILDIKVDELRATRTIHRGVWLVAEDTGKYRAGSTYTWHDTTTTPTEKGREEVVARLKRFLRLPFTVTGQRAGVRPNIHGFLPVIGSHPVEPGLAMFNGLGSKGSLLAPKMAAMLAGHLLSGDAIPRDIDVRRRMAGERP